MADPHWKRLPAIACLCLACCTSLLHAEDLQSNQLGDVKAKTQNSLVQTKNRELNTENEKLAQNLVEEHLPDLMPLLKQLKSDKSKQYEKAIWDLSRSARKLSLTRKRDARLFDIELELLKAETNANLIAARLKVRDKPEDRDNLREAVTRMRSAQEGKFRYEIKLRWKQLKSVYRNSWKPGSFCVSILCRDASESRAKANRQQKETKEPGKVSF